LAEAVNGPNEAGIQSAFDIFTGPFIAYEFEMEQGRIGQSMLWAGSIKRQRVTQQLGKNDTW